MTTGLLMLQTPVVHTKQTKNSTGHEVRIDNDSQLQEVKD